MLRISKGSIYAFNRKVGSGSRSQNLLREDRIIRLLSSNVAGVKEESREVVCAEI